MYTEKAMKKNTRVTKDSFKFWLEITNILTADDNPIKKKPKSLIETEEMVFPSSVSQSEKP